jgi:hypothetical protein
MRGSGRRRSDRGCPEWCARGHACTAQHGYPGGEHRSDPVTLQMLYGTMVATRVVNLAGRGRLELRLQVDLAADEHLAGAQAARIGEEVDRAVRRALATAPGWIDAVELDLSAVPVRGAEP